MQIKVFKILIQIYLVQIFEVEYFCIRAVIECLAYPASLVSGQYQAYAVVMVRMHPFQ
jgi:hypothetical protein